MFTRRRRKRFTSWFNSRLGLQFRNCYGKVAEWLKAPQLRNTGNRVEGSNPLPFLHLVLPGSALIGWAGF